MFNVLTSSGIAVIAISMAVGPGTLAAPLADRSVPSVIPVTHAGARTLTGIPKPFIPLTDTPIPVPVPVPTLSTTTPALFIPGPVIKGPPVLLSAHADETQKLSVTRQHQHVEAYTLRQAQAAPSGPPDVMEHAYPEPPPLQPIISARRQISHTAPLPPLSTTASGAVVANGTASLAHSATVTKSPLHSHTGKPSVVVVTLGNTTVTLPADLAGKPYLHPRSSKIATTTVTLTIPGGLTAPFEHPKSKSKPTATSTSSTSTSTGTATGAAVITVTTTVTVDVEEPTLVARQVADDEGVYFWEDLVESPLDEPEEKILARDFEQSRPADVPGTDDDPDDGQGYYWDESRYPKKPVDDEPKKKKQVLCRPSEDRVKAEIKELLHVFEGESGFLTGFAALHNISMPPQSDITMLLLHRYLRGEPDLFPIQLDEGKTMETLREVKNGVGRGEQD